MNINDIINGEYLIVEELGQGGMGRVMRALHLPSGGEVALKYCTEIEENTIKRFKREVRIMSETVHDNIVKILSSNVDYSPPFFTMPLAFKSLDKLIPDIKSDTSKLFSVFNDICKGISAMHSLGHFHRDIKPSNVLIFANDQVCVSDFGLAKKNNPDSAAHSSSNGFLGTPAYHAPEQTDAKTSDARTDIYQLGKTLYELFTGDNPYTINPTKISVGLKYIIQKATSIDPNDRFQTVDELQQFVQDYESSLNPNANPVDAFNNKLNEVNDLISQNASNERECLELLDLLNKFSNEPESFIKLFDKIPTKLLRLFSSSLQEHFEISLKTYDVNLKAYSASRFLDFAYAETVAEKMAAIYSATNRPDFKELSLLNAMQFAVGANRFSAMGTVDLMLQNTKTSADALVISRLLNKNLETYSKIYDRLPKNALHYLLQPSWEEAKKFIKEENDRREQERREWI